MTFMRKFMDFLTLDKKNPIVFNEESCSNSLLEESCCIPSPNSFINDSVCDLSITNQENSVLLQSDSLTNSESLNPEKYVSSRLVIPGLNIFFIDICREIIQSGKISRVPIMREYHLEESDLECILNQIYCAGIIDRDYNLIMDSDSFEKYIDLYEPNIFQCKNCVFDKEIFMCIGEIIFSDCVDSVYDSMPPNEVIDYLTVFERLNILSYDSVSNEYKLLIDKSEFEIICSQIPESFSSLTVSSVEAYNTNCDFDSLSGLEFEKFIASLLLKNKYQNVEITPPSGDHGIDILAEKDNITFSLQCKCYSGNVGNSAVQQAHTGKSIYHTDISIVVTNRFFTQQAIEEASALGVKLWDRNKILELISNS